jgi:tetratricopeptide (TPR) repeat protein
MKNNLSSRLCTFWIVAMLSLTVSAAVSAGVVNEALLLLQSQWAAATYETAVEEREDALSALADKARELCADDCRDPELLIWKGIIVSSLAGEQGGLGALGLAKEARASLERALEIEPQALQGSAYTSLGTLYHKVPGWPIGFGSDKKARSHLDKALTINPDGVDPNYFMAEFMLDEGEYQKAREHLLKALAAPQRPGREVADAGRRQEVNQMLAKVEAKLN